MCRNVSLFVLSSLLPSVYSAPSSGPFLKILNQAECKIWFFLAHWDDYIFPSHTSPSKWSSFDWKGKTSENLLLTSRQIPTESWPGKLIVTSLSCRRTVDVGALSERGCAQRTRSTIMAMGDDVSINAWVGETLNKLKVTAWDIAASVKSTCGCCNWQSRTMSSQKDL